MLHLLKDKYEEEVKILIYIAITLQAQLITQRCAAKFSAKLHRSERTTLHWRQWFISSSHRKYSCEGSF